jgi:acylglycerol lipase
MLIGVANLLPKHKLVPQKDLAEAAFRDPKNRKLVYFLLRLLLKP